MLKLDAYKLKWIAIIAMVLNHMVITWWAIFPHALRFPLYMIGGATFPLMAFFVVEGYKYTSNLKRYILRICIFALISTPFYMVAIVGALGMAWLNIMFTIAFSLVVLLLYDKIKIRLLFWVLYVLVIVPFSFIAVEWGFVGVTMVLLYHIIRNESARRIVPPIFAAVGMLLMAGMVAISPQSVDVTSHPLFENPDFLPVMATFPIGCASAAVLLKCYNGERGKKMKWLFYAFYPAHLIVLVVVGLALGLVDLSALGL